MTQTPGPTAGPTNSTHTTGLDRFFGWIRSVDLRRDADDKWLAGVCSGIATRLGVDPIVIRAALVLLVILGGVGITIYLIAWAFLPNNRDEIVAEKALRDGDVLGIILLVIIGLSLIGGTGLAGDTPGIGWIWWVVVPIGLVVWLVTRNRDGKAQGAAASTRSRTRRPPTRRPPPRPPPRGPPSPPPSGPRPRHPPTGTATAAPETYAPQTQEYAAVPPTTYAPAPADTPPGGTYFPPPTPAAPRPPRPPKVPRRKSGGFISALLVGGLALAAYGATLSIHDAANWAGSDETVALAAALGGPRRRHPGARSAGPTGRLHRLPGRSCSPS